MEQTQNRYKFSYNNYLFWAMAVLAPICIKVVLNRLINEFFGAYLMRSEGIGDIVELNIRFADSGLGVMSTGIASFLVILITIRLISMDERNRVGGIWYGLHKTDMTKAVAYAILAGLVAILINFIVNIMFDSAQMNYKSTERVLFSGALIMRLFILGIIVPVCEEYIFHGIVYKRLTIRVGEWTAVLASALLFGVYHMNLLQGIYAGFMGFLIGVVYKKEKNLLIPFICHSFANITIILFERFMN